jgi:spermidine synthase
MGQNRPRLQQRSTTAGCSRGRIEIPIGKPRNSLAKLYPLFFLSGASSLIFENLWQRKLMLVFGASAPSITVILTAFFCGIAFGSWWGGRLLTRFERRWPAMRFYALTEVWIGIFGICVPLFLRAVDAIYLTLFSDLDPGPGFSLVYRFVMCTAVVFPASVGMGATVPVMSRLISEHGKGIGRSVGLAYGVNTLGAVAGCLATGFFLLERLGMQNSLFFASALNAVVVIASFWISRRATAVAKTPEPPPPGAERIEAGRAVLLALYFAAGFIAIGFEVTWMRMVAIFTTNGVTTFHLGLAVYLTGFSLGSLLLYPLLEKKRTGLQIFFVSCAGVALTCLAILPNAQAITNWIVVWTFRNAGWLPVDRVLAMEVMNTLSIMFLPTVFMGLAFPAVCRAGTEKSEQIAASSGAIYFVGNIGSMAGAFVTGLLLIPALSLVGVSGLFIVTSFLLGAIALSLGTARDKRFLQLACLVLSAPALLYAISDAPLVHVGRPEKAGDHWRFAIGTGGYRVVLRNQTGMSATITVMEIEDPPGQFRRVIHVDDQPVAGSEASARVDSKLLAHIPLLLHPEPETALTVGFGSGGTSWSMTTHGVQTDVVEIEKEVVRSAHLFEEQNFDVVDSKLLTVVLNDARNHLYVTKKQYDVISTDSTNLQYKQNGSLYTREYFELMKARLTADGIGCAWIPMQLTEAQFDTLVASFQSVFPYTTLWYMDHVKSNYAILIGTPGPIRFDSARLARAFERPAVREDLAAVGIYHPFQLIHFLYLDGPGVSTVVSGAPLHTDDRPILEFPDPHPFRADRFLLEPRIREMWALKPKRLDPLIANLETTDISELRRWESFAAAWGAFTNFEQFAPEAMRKRPEYWRRGLRLIEQALEAVPDYPLALKKREQFQNQRRE